MASLRQRSDPESRDALIACPVARSHSQFVDAGGFAPGRPSPSKRRRGPRRAKLPVDKQLKLLDPTDAVRRGYHHRQVTEHLNAVGPKLPNLLTIDVCRSLARCEEFHL